MKRLRFFDQDRTVYGRRGLTLVSLGADVYRRRGHIIDARTLRAGPFVHVNQENTVTLVEASFRTSRLAYCALL